MNYSYAWVGAMATVYLALLTAPLVLGSWVVLQRTRALGAGVWLMLLLTMLVAALILGAIGLYLVGSTPYGSIRGA